MSPTRPAGSFAVARLASLAVVAAAGLPLPALAQTYRIDPTHTFVHFEVPHFATSTARGRIGRADGTVTFDRAAKAGRVDITLGTASVDTGTDSFDRHLRGKDFLDAERHPTARFVAERLVFQGEKVAEVPGMLTLLGRSHPVTLRATNFDCHLNPLLRREVCGGDFESTIARSQWGLTWGVDAGFADQVRLLVQVEAIRE